MKRYVIAAVMALGLTAPTTFAFARGGVGGFATPSAPQALFPQSSVPGGAFTVNGQLGGNLSTTTLPGGVGQGILMNNGNGTSTVVGPNGIPLDVPTPR